MVSQTDMLAALLAAPAQDQTRYPPNSRYHGVKARTRTLPDGRQATYLVPRIPPDPAEMSVLAIHTVVALERTDTLAERYFGNALVSWRIGDANGRGIPEELMQTPGRRLRIAVPNGGG